MPARSALSDEDLLAVFRSFGRDWLAPRQLLERLDVSRSTLQRRLIALEAAGHLEVRGAGALREYRLTNTGAANLLVPMATLKAHGTPGPTWSPESQALRAYVQQPRAARTPVSYQEHLLADYTPNESFWLPSSLRSKLAAAGQSAGERPAGTFARDVLNQLLIDLSWSSSRLEGNRYTRLETKTLIEAAQKAEGKTRQETVMVLNHKRAIEFLVDIAPYNDQYRRVIANMHAQLMDGLLHDESALGALRKRLVYIEESVYVPLALPAEIERLFDLLCAKAQAIADPLEASFFLLTQVAYLQPFEDGNKRTARVASNLPLAKANYAPLAFLDVDDQDYFLALMAIYEKADVTVAVDLFEWAYLRSVQNFTAVKQAMAEPDAFRTRLRPQLSLGIQQVVVHAMTPKDSVATLDIADVDREPLMRLIERELATLTEYNHARYGLTFKQFDVWRKAKAG
jgi:hypothetical protein